VVKISGMKVNGPNPLPLKPKSKWTKGLAEKAYRRNARLNIIRLNVKFASNFAEY